MQGVDPYRKLVGSNPLHLKDIEHYCDLANRLALQTCEKGLVFMGHHIQSLVMEMIGL